VSGPGHDIAVFEGFFDLLSALAWYGREQFTRPTIVLNAVAMRERAIAAIRQRQPGQVSLYLDRDPVGWELTTLFGEQLADIPWGTPPTSIAGYKDFNAFWWPTKITSRVSQPAFFLFTITSSFLSLDKSPSHFFWVNQQIVVKLASRFNLSLR
jgi:hypothetical protein